MKYIKSLEMLIIYMLILVGSCTNYESNVEPFTKNTRIITNQAPTSATIVFDADTVFINDTVGVSCIVEDPDENESFSFEWASFKVTENSTDDNYEYDYWRNNGKFIRGGANAFWTPGMAIGKYIIFCNAMDKGGVQLFTTKIINASLGAGITALTDSITYHTDGTYSRSNRIYIRLYNYSNDILKVNICRGPQVLFERMDLYIWGEYSPAGGGCRADMEPYSYIYPDQYITSIDRVPLAPGFYRLKIEYQKGGSKIGKEYIYTTEFEVKKR